ncbi:transposase IS3/IS911 family protein [Segniliparus rotundus DSM 44985]|uniref:Transposase IS3/IS911 family protein n=1 Tax=Segniliparus rotundus (strain ATCC BAA-972 / CDC 1076 / CIP 108378 / DSM 44985 / JCM 13578) TaxID=640132 RepID=D6Z9E2_SEGRD|nr:transposase [Segniliparus rotundus]ADG97629.1 transposase IS3/IS911 family protein [Segniliparus rotundus DSM 44985]ADG98572.1 transposase IS3/IS911 family protein [Segniliparus rotundus DSM 44985]ADG99352.1 transposase IS3/IS911 family protein [Segniliparus rotundus DSM 44985]
MAAHPEEFRRRATEAARAAREGGRPVAWAAKELGVDAKTLRKWLAQADGVEGKRVVREGGHEGIAGDERAELVRLRRENRVLAMEVEILKRASAIFARESLPTPK